MDNIYSYTIGDLSADGHGRTSEVYFRSNKTKRELLEIESKITSVFGIRYDDEVASEYEDNSVPEKLIKKMKELNHYSDDWFGEVYTQEELDEYNKNTKYFKLESTTSEYD